MKYIKQTLIAGVVALYGSLSSCNFLNVDEYFMDTFSYDSVFATKRNIERYLWNIPTWFVDEADIWTGDTKVPGVIASDECTAIWNDWSGMKFVLGQITPDNREALFDIWLQNYKIIRKTNFIFHNIDQVPDITAKEKREMIAYAHFMRGYAYLQMLENYGPLLIQGDDILPTNEDMDYYDRPRSTYDESVEYVFNELELAAQGMPGPKSVSMTQFGRPNRDVALALIARVRLMHASNAFNGGDAAKRYFGSWKRSTDNVLYVSQSPDNKRWAVAAYAASRLMQDGNYKLHTVERDEDTPTLPATVPSAAFPDGAGDIDPYKSYKEMFSGESVPFRNPEIIWGKWSGEVYTMLEHVFPDLYGGANGLCIPQKIVDAYSMTDGTNYMDAGVNEQETMTGNKTFSGYQLRSGTNNMYDNREMRFYACVGFSGRYWAMESTTEQGKRNKVINYEYDGNNGKSNDNGRYPLSGYTMVKYVHDDDARDGAGAMVTSKAFTIIRYAETLLSYAEALNEIEGSHTIVDEEGNSHTFTRDYTEIERSINQIRYRAGQPGIPKGLNRDQIFELIVRERMIEFLFENRRYYDVRRWGIYEKVDLEPIMGMDADMPGKNFYNRIRLNHLNIKNRITSTKMVFLPIWNNELRKMTLLDQNPGWAD